MSSVTSARRATRPAPPQVSHGSGISWPVPWHVPHGAVVISVPKTLRRALWISPVPPHVRQAIGAVPGCAPLPRHVSHTASRSSSSVATQPEDRVAEGDVQAHGEVLTAARASARAAAPPGAAEPTEAAGPKNISKISERSAKPAPAGPLDVAEGVVARTLVGVGQDLVGAGDLLEPLLRRPDRRSRPGGARARAVGRRGGSRRRWRPPDAEDLVEVADGRHHCSASCSDASVSRSATARTAVIAER